jgi:purine-cytosine permease-like protein
LRQEAILGEVVVRTLEAAKAAILPALALILLCTASSAQAVNPTDGGNIAVPISTFGNREWMTALILVFGMFIIVIEYLLLKNRISDKVEDVGKYLVITIIIIGTLALMVGSLDNNQTAPAVGLFGTIAGYLLGRSDKSRADQIAEDVREEHQNVVKNGTKSAAKNGTKGPTKTADKSIDKPKEPDDARNAA